MTKEEIQHLYREHILPESNNPYHFESDKKANIKLEAYNPMCGDKFYLHLNEENKLFEAVHFHGYGCAISMASTSLLLKKIDGMSTNDGLHLCKQFLDSLTDDSISELMDEDLQYLAELKNFDGRIDCIKLSWETLLTHLNYSMDI